MRYEIKGGVFPVVVCDLQSGEKMITERGSMVWMTPNMKMETKGGGIGKMFSKMFSGESMFQNIYTSQGDCMMKPSPPKRPAPSFLLKWIDSSTPASDARKAFFCSIMS